MAKVQVEQVFRNKEKKDGSPYLDKYGKPYTLTKVLCEGRYFTVWGTKEQLEEIKSGSVLEGEIKEGEFNGNKTYSLSLPKPASREMQEILDRLEKLEDRVLVLEKAEFASPDETVELGF